MQDATLLQEKRRAELQSSESRTLPNIYKSLDVLYGDLILRSEMRDYALMANIDRRC